MAEIRVFPLFRHLRGDPCYHLLRYRGGQLVDSGRGIAFRVVDPVRLSERVDFSVDLKTGALVEQPLVKA